MSVDVAAGATPLLQVRNVSKRFGGVLANDDISITVERGQIAGLIGPNGSGKTTLFNSIVGEHAVDGGSVRFDGRDLANLRVAETARLGLVRTFQQAQVFGALTCLQNMQVSQSRARERPADMFAKLSRAGREKADALLELVLLQEQRHVLAAELSFGQRKALELSMALMSDPQMLLLDEPTAGINPTLINDIVERLRQINAAFGVTLLIIEHNMRVIMDLAARIFCLAHGQLLAEGTPGQIQSDPRVIDAYLGSR